MYVFCIPLHHEGCCSRILVQRRSRPDIQGTTLLLETDFLQPGWHWTWLTIVPGFSIGWLKAKLLFRGCCQRQLARIALLRRPGIWQFHRPGFLLFLAAMIIIGSSLSRMAHSNYPFLIVLMILDFSLATALSGSSIAFRQQPGLKKNSRPEAPVNATIINEH